MDVNVANFGIKRIIVYEGDTVESLVADFVKRCPIDEFMIEKLKLLLQQQMDGVLERIDEDEERRTDQSALTDPEEGEGAAEMRSDEKQENDFGSITEAKPAINAPEMNVGDGIMASAAPHEVEDDEALAETIDAKVNQKFVEREVAQPFSDE